MARWLVTGASRGIGLELVRELHARGDDVIATCRTRTPELDAIGCRVVDGIDVGSDDVGAALVEALGDEQPVDVVVNNAGVARWDTLDTVDIDAARQELEVNALGPLRVTLALLPRLGAGARIALVSSKAGSIGDGPSGRNYGYRMSKAALNMLGANLAADLAARRIHVAVLHPGFVRTEMTGGGGNLDPPDSAAGLIRQIDALDASRSGRFFHSDGSEVVW
jgi:NAD(P)-dependent dehydrogenase (short-subunit alcohol dehydrogenase family)